MKSFPKGNIDFKFNFKPKVPGGRFLMFYGVDLGGATEPSCGGELINVSDPNAGYFDACSSSTSFVDG